MSQNNPTVSANSLTLNAANDIGSDVTALSILSNLLNAKSNTGNINLISNGNIITGSIQTPNKLTLKTNGGIYQAGGSATNITANEMLLKAKNGVGDDGVSKNPLNTSVNIIDIYNSNINDIALINNKSLKVKDLDADGYALYNSGGNIDIKTEGDFIQVIPGKIYAKKDVSLDTENDMYINKIKAGNNIILQSQNGNIYGNKSTKPNLTANNSILLYAVNGYVGTPEKPVYVASSTTNLAVRAKKSNDFVSAYIFGILSKQNRHSDDDLSVFENRPVSGNLIDVYNSVLRQIFDSENIHTKNALFVGSNSIKEGNTYIINQ